LGDLSNSPTHQITQSLNRQITQSLVVHDGGEISGQSIAMREPIAVPLDLPVLDPGLPLERLQQQDIQIAEDFLSRRSQLANAPYLAAQILKRLYPSRLKIALFLERESAILNRGHYIFAYGHRTAAEPYSSRRAAYGAARLGSQSFSFERK